LKRPAEAGSLKPGSFIILNGEPCRIVSTEKSKPGKHGSAKVRIVAIGIFDGAKRTFVGPASAQVEVPMVEKRTGQVISITPHGLQLMDMETYEMFELPMPEDEEIKGKLAAGVEVEYWNILNRKKIMRVK